MRDQFAKQKSVPDDLGAVSPKSVTWRSGRRLGGIVSWEKQLFSSQGGSEKTARGQEPGTRCDATDC